MFLTDIKPVVGIGGAIGGCIVNFSFPALMYIRASDQKFTYYKNVFASLFGIFGIACGGVSTYIAVIDVIKMFKKK
ncbi:hypothetical protein TVAG_251530 [Trichomonas vaginalis G3]|uniref:Uncharacterized protein n=1 Tax=Trichomonas vaginalis (strain ATCC PRA-98 / G3) TaxID=412133 RepID=A2EF11_TRIV3|nr:amino acid transmembrane transporter protein [Trichomonas vaginalis G3]EAY08727.1 hypothetical protein TVAG_251530 [Trichomonas vaginalis G3]KAI5507136.1 amino acid transmembrane transporter protein [Trichomonas vaginalis G3]|eukprot:XP_001320950.1 hypothetical protein [Trichomonas vaginalis G3]